MTNKDLSYRELEYPFTTELDVLIEHFGDTDKYAELLSVLNPFIAKHDEFPLQKELLKIIKAQACRTGGINE